MLMLQCGNVIVVMPQCTYHCFFNDYCHCHCQWSLQFLLLHKLLLIQLFTLLLYIIATYSGADVTIAMYFTKKSTATSASLVVIYSELLHHFLLLFSYNFIFVCCCRSDGGSSSLYFLFEFCLLQWLFFKRYWWKCSFHCYNDRQEFPIIISFSILLYLLCAFC